MKKSYLDMAKRADNAVIAWRDMLSDNFTAKQADKILSVYIKLKIVKLDWGIGRYNVKHGAFLDNNALNNALNYEG